MLLRWLLRRAAYCVPLGSVVIRSTRGGTPYPHTAAGVGARLEPGAGSAGGRLGSLAGRRRFLRWGVCGLHPGATRSSASARRAAQDEARWAGHRGPGSTRAHRSHRIARAVTEQSCRSVVHTLLLAPLLPASRFLAAEGYAPFPGGEDMLGLGKIVRHEIWLLHDIVQ